MARFTKQRRPDPVRIQAARVAAARVQVASATAALEEQVEAAVPPNLEAELDSIRDRLTALEP